LSKLAPAGGSVEPSPSSKNVGGVSLRKFVKGAFQDIMFPHDQKLKIMI
jgi:hypothetical protein